MFLRKYNKVKKFMYAHIYVLFIYLFIYLFILVRVVEEGSTASADLRENPHDRHNTTPYLVPVQRWIFL